ncbi:S8 family serine peptidase [Falsihalocynthiibacter sp. CO-5D18]|uniref:S8 family serine peptidase n=1 Tax=Falsihalocynthiibacter sp. CO-5D18 TaxID=3240872 RepID=UPI003510241B
MPHPIVNDPMLSQQWHLRNSGSGLFDLNIVGANGIESLWDDYTGADINVFVIDNGFDYTHEDLAANYATLLDYNFTDDDDNPFGIASNSHGTAVMGIIGAVGNNDIGTTGIAYEATLVGYRIENFIGDAWLQNVRDSIASAATGGADVVNISQGIANDTSSEFGIGYDATRFTEIDASISLAVSTGRGGLGTTIVKSAGNSRGAHYDVNSDPWTNNTQQVVVAAVDQDGFISSYSSYGAANLISGFGSSGEVVTTDRTDNEGYTTTNYMSTFNGTSAAAPMVAGVVTLMYDAEEGLGWRDVQTILAYTGRHVGSVVDNATFAGSERTPWHFNAAENWNGGGLHYSNDYGYGLVDAHAAVRLAESWLTMGAAQTSLNARGSLASVAVAATIPDENATGTSFELQGGEAILVERVAVTLTFSTTFLGDMVIYLTSPEGEEHLLIANQAGGAVFDGAYTFESQAFRGERSDGTWTVRIADVGPGDILTVSDIVLTTTGSEISADDRYIFTDAFSDYAGISNHRVAFDDTNGGADWINAAAVTTGVTLNFATGTGVIDGVAITVSDVENAYTGDGNDHVELGDTATTAHQIHLGRGNDSVEVTAETIDGLWNTYDGGQGNDTFYFHVVSQSSGHVINLEDGVITHDGVAQASVARFENVNVSGAAGSIGTSAQNVFYAQGNFGNTIDGRGGNDFINAGGGNDYLIGGLGADYLNGGNGFDRAEYLDATTGIRADLQYSSANTGEAAGDTYISVEGLGGSIHNDILLGDAGGNSLLGRAGNDGLYGRGGTDTLYGQAGNDHLEGGEGNDALYGGAGTDVAQYTYATSAVWAFLETGGTLGDAAGDTYFSIENLSGSNFDDRLIGDTGANTLVGRFGNDVIFGRDGDDALVGNQGDDRLEGGNGADVLYGGTGMDQAQYYYATSGVRADLVLTGTNTGAAAGDTYHSIENMVGSGFNDVLAGDGTTNTLWGVNGNDSLLGRGGNDTLIGGNGNDYLDGGTGSDRLYGGLGIDRANYINAASGLRVDLQITWSNTGEAAGDTYFSIENIGGSNHNDLLIGDAGANLLLGRNGSDTLYGREGVDRLYGQYGQDRLAGGTGNDFLNGGVGADTFVFGTGSGSDFVDDFVVNVDRIEICSGANNYSDLTFTTAGADTIISFSNVAIRLDDVLPGQLDEGDFAFV